MGRFVSLVASVLGVGMILGRLPEGISSTAEAGGEGGGSPAQCTAENGDVNADGNVDISDGITILQHLFLGNPSELVPLCTPTAVPKGLPRTGQSTCYEPRGAVVDCTSETCAGQDGFYQTGCSNQGRFVDNGDGTVTDTCTGLMWQKDTGNDAKRLVWCNALAYCEDLELGGHDDWRLPNVRELQSILDYGRSSPAIDPIFGALPSFYWSSTSIDVDPTGAWAVSFAAGVIIGGTKDRDRVVDNDSLVRAVRSGI
ncbi:MAG TPA: DUF1566 domain-containing protein [Planctomycetota bacterium]|nr:DUF1566 domain-containing protein [Planctomycetota bacterium]